MSDVIRELFANIKVEDVPTEKNHVIEIASTETIEEAFSVRDGGVGCCSPVVENHPRRG